MTVRHAAVSGAFYSSEADTLLEQLSLWCAEPEMVRNQPKALIVPHAGYCYSGEVAAAAYLLLLPFSTSINRVILIGPSHHTWLTTLALPTASHFSTPLGTVPLDMDTIRALKERPEISMNDQAHKPEHSLEVQLPFLQYCLDKFELVPMLVGDVATAASANILQKIWGGSETLIVVSTDLSHFHPYEAAKAQDLHSCEQIELFNTELVSEQACGARAVNGFLHAAHSNQMKIERMMYCNSGDTAGNKDKVVGYASFCLH